MDAAHPFDLPQDFDFSALGDAYASGDYTIDEVAAEFNISRDTFLAIRKAAPHKWTKRNETNLWWSDLTQAEGDLVEKATAQAKAKRVDRKAKRKVKREEKRAAEQWWKLESALERAVEDYSDWRSGYQPPKLQIPQSLDSLPDGAAVFNLQDLHVGAAFSKSDLSASEYISRIKDAFRNGLRRATRNAQVQRLYLVVGADLVHVDNHQGQTTSGTPQDLAMSPDEALSEAIKLAVELVDLARQVASDVRLVPVRGNHDRMLGLAAAHAVDRHFHSAGDVQMLEVGERIYDTYGEHLLCFTHGQMKKRVMKRFGDLITSEARSLLGETTFTTCYTGHLHFQAQDMEDISGRLMQQASSPKRADTWHEQEGYVGARKAIQMHLLEPDTVSDATFSLAA